MGQRDASGNLPVQLAKEANSIEAALLLRGENLRLSEYMPDILTNASSDRNSIDHDNNSVHSINGDEVGSTSLPDLSTISSTTTTTTTIAASNTTPILKRNSTSNTRAIISADQSHTTIGQQQQQHTDDTETDEDDVGSEDQPNTDGEGGKGVDSNKETDTEEDQRLKTRDDVLRGSKLLYIEDVELDIYEKFTPHRPSKPLPPVTPELLAIAEKMREEAQFELFQKSQSRFESMALASSSASSSGDESGQSSRSSKRRSLEFSNPESGIINL